ncbi:MAG TPA: hypothetical protein VLD67_06990, partial [Vicinamibacterales bacterium]|nr:hypothetical protein [Vicinamibacterales bacterium]
TVSWTPGATFRLADEDGRPIADAYVRFHYDGHLINPVHPVSYVASGSVIIRPDAAGRVTIPGRVHFRRPLPLSLPPSLFVDHVYVPRLHNAFGPIAKQTMPRPGVFSISEDRNIVSVADVSGAPERWELSLRHLYDCIRETLTRNGSRTSAASGDMQTAAHARALADHLRREYAAFLAVYGRVARQRPSEPEWGSERDRQLWREQIDAQLAREPLWGPFVERTWESTLKELERLEGSAR